MGFHEDCVVVSQQDSYIISDYACLCVDGDGQQGKTFFDTLDYNSCLPKSTIEKKGGGWIVPSNI